MAMERHVDVEVRQSILRHGLVVKLVEGAAGRFQVHTGI